MRSQARGRPRGTPAVAHSGSSTAGTGFTEASVRSTTMPSWRFAPVRQDASGVPRRVSTGCWPPLLAGTLVLSTHARSRSSWFAHPSSLRSTWCRRVQTPALCQPRSRLRQVIPLPHPISWRSISQGMPVLRTTMMPARLAQSGTRGRQPMGVGDFGRSSGSVRSHSASGARGVAIFPPFTTHAARAVPWF